MEVNGHTIGVAAGSIGAAFGIVFKLGRTLGSILAIQKSIENKQNQMSDTIGEIYDASDNIQIRMSCVENSFKVFQTEHERFCREVVDATNRIADLDKRVTVLESKESRKEK